MNRSVMDINPEEMQPLSKYTVYANDDDELLIVLPGYYRGTPGIKEIHYDGGAHAILVRNDHQYILCDYLDEGVRRLMYDAEQVLIYEKDVFLEYMVKVVHSDVEKLAKKCLKIHDYSFTFHPFPVATDSLDVGKAKCGCCGRTTMLSYTGPMYPRVDSVTLCPKCISTGKATKKFNATLSFTLGSVPGHMYDVILHNTVPFHAKEFLDVQWACHCDGLCTYLGRVEPEDITEELWAEVLETWNHAVNFYQICEADKVRERINKAELAAHLFVCGKCEKHLMYFTEE